MGKKKGKKEKASTGGLESTGLEESEVRTLEYYQVKVADLTEKLDRLKSKNELLVKENTTLAKAQAKFYSDKQDIVEFLNIKVGEHEKMIANLEVKNKALDLEKRTIEQRMKQDFDLYQKTAQEETEQLHAQVSRLKSELTELNQFQKQKADLDEQLKHVKHLLERKEKEFAETIHNLERKVLQDKSQMKREMLQKVNEAVANFRRVADQQMAETTKRAIRENLAISSQLKKMSVKTVELIEENDQLHAQVEKLKKGNQLLVDSEKELAKRNISSQKAVKMLIEKLKESDQMLELAFDEPEKEPEPDKQYLTEEMIQV
jgi:myosin heavy subunit